MRARRPSPPSPASLRVRFALLVSCLAAAASVGAVWFGSGFFLTRLELPDASECGADGFDGGGCWMPSRYRRVVFVVVDALRFDFVSETADGPAFANAMPSLQRALRESPSRARLFRFRADPPTVTMQRLKGLTTGGLPTFVDVRDNFASSAVECDSWVGQYRRAGWDSAFVGDDTWADLFPDHFTRAHPYPSFNVKDLHTVDRGCERHLVPEMGRDGWRLVVAHFLGVDHVGHLHRPDHPAMREKLLETDAAVARAMRLAGNDTLLLVLGDHGMTADGNHGGATPEETGAALFAYSPGATFGDRADATAEVDQIDVVPTLSLLAGLPVPFGNLGAVIPDLFDRGGGTGCAGRWDEALRAMELNAAQVAGYMEAYDRATGLFGGGGGGGSGGLSQVTRLLAEAGARLGEVREGDASGGNEACARHEAAAAAYRAFFDAAVAVCREKWTTFDARSMAWGGLALGLAALALAAQAAASWGAASAAARAASPAGPPRVLRRGPALLGACQGALFAVGLHASADFCAAVAAATGVPAAVLALPSAPVAVAAGAACGAVLVGLLQAALARAAGAWQRFRHRADSPAAAAAAAKAGAGDLGGVQQARVAARASAVGRVAWRGAAVAAVAVYAQGLFGNSYIAAEESVVSFLLASLVALGVFAAAPAATAAAAGRAPDLPWADPAAAVAAAALVRLGGNAGTGPFALPTDAWGAVRVAGPLAALALGWPWADAAAAAAAPSSPPGNGPPAVLRLPAGAVYSASMAATGAYWAAVAWPSAAPDWARLWLPRGVFAASAASAASVVVAAALCRRKRPARGLPPGPDLALHESAGPGARRAGADRIRDVLARATAPAVRAGAGEFSAVVAGQLRWWLLVARAAVPPLCLLLGPSTPWLLLRHGALLAALAVLAGRAAAGRGEPPLFLAHAVAAWLGGLHLWAAAGHSSSFGSLHASAPFVGFDSFSWWRGAAMLGGATFGPHALTFVLLPAGALLAVAVYARRTPAAVSSLRLTADGARSYCFSLAGGAVQAALALYAGRALLSAANAWIQRRHLMVWAVFAPKFVFDAATLVAAAACGASALLFQAVL